MRFGFFSLLAVSTVGAFLACGVSDLGTGSGVPDATPLVRDGGLVDPSEAGPASDAALGPAPTCERYCDLVTANCTGMHAQYEAKDDCLAFCRHLPLTDRTGENAEHQASVECRQYWADTPARTNPKDYCLSAGPFGGNVCGYRCTAFCDVALSACAVDGGGNAAFDTQATCASACTTYAYRDAGADGGGEGPDGPTSSDTLNCRQYWLREATKNPEKCAALRAVSELCK